MAYYVYILASGRNGTLYTGSTRNPARRFYEHQEKAVPGFTARYGVGRLVWYEAHDSQDDAFKRERQIKEWKRLWKLELIERFNPAWRDLTNELLT
jgi:putative endonuclease